MKLFEVTNGLVGESYVRCYVWAASEKDALTMALLNRINYSTVAIVDSKNLKVKELFDSSSAPFCTNWDDAGFER